MNENNEFSNSINGTELKCSLCRESLLKDEEMTQKVIDGSQYFFHSQKCFSIYKRMEHFYGKNIRNFIENKQMVYDTMWDKAIPTSEEIEELKNNNNKSSKPILKVIENPEEAIRTAINLIQSAEDEVITNFFFSKWFLQENGIRGWFSYFAKITRQYKR